MSSMQCCSQRKEVALTVAINSHTKGKYKYQMMGKILSMLIVKSEIWNAWLASVRRSESVNSAISTFHSVVKLGPDFRVYLLPSHDVPIKHITLNFMPICSTMCSVLTLATLAMMVKNGCAKPVLEH